MASRLELTPELVLVSPDLAEVARAALPDRPWEMFIPRVPLDHRRGAVSAADPPAMTTAVVDLPRELGLVPVPVPVPVPAPAPAPALPQHVRVPHPIPAPRRRPQSTWRTVALTMAVLAALLVLSSRPVPDAPTFAAERPSHVPAANQAAVTAAPQTPSSAKAASAGAAASDRRATAPAKKPIKSRAGTPSAQRPPLPATGRGGSVPGGGYVFGGDGRLLVAADGKTITRFEAVVCGTNVRFSGIVISQTGRFTASQTMQRSGGELSVRISGHVAAPGLIRGNLTSAAPRCGPTTRRYTARIS